MSLSNKKTDIRTASLAVARTWLRQKVHLVRVVMAIFMRVDLVAIDLTRIDLVKRSSAWLCSYM